MRVLVLGQRGMLGHVVERRCVEIGFETEVIPHRWPTEEFKKAIQTSRAEFCINAIGRIPQKTVDFTANFDLPVWLDMNFGGKGVVHPSSDCEWDNSEYGRSKRAASDWIDEHGEKTKRVLTSIVGFELDGCSSLLGWFLSNAKGSIVSGFSNHFWNGITTLAWANYVIDMVERWEESPRVSVLSSSSCISKYDLLIHFNNVFQARLNVHSTAHDAPANKCISEALILGSIEDMLVEMRNWY